MADRSHLQEGTVLHVDVGSATALVAAEVLAFLGPVVVLRPLERLATRVQPGASGYVLLDQEGRRSALACAIVVADERTLALRVKDPFRLGQHRRWSRIPLEVTATVAPAGGPGEPVETTTLDLSPGGAALRRPAGLRVWPRYAITLGGGPLGDPPIAVEASPARASERVLAVRFTAVAPADEQRLVEVLLRAAPEPPFTAAVARPPAPRMTGCAGRAAARAG